MATLGYVAPHSTQTTEGFHALRRTTEGLLYYTKVNKDSVPSSLLSRVKELPSKEELGVGE